MAWRGKLEGSRWQIKTHLSTATCAGLADDVCSPRNHSMADNAPTVPSEATVTVCFAAPRRMSPAA